MQINFQSKPTPYSKKLNPSFQGVKLLNVNLKEVLPNGTIRTIPAFFTRLTKEDTPLIQSIAEQWANLRFGPSLIKEFMQYTAKGRKTFLHLNSPVRKNFFMIERKDKSNPIERIVSLMAANIHLNRVYLEYLQSSSKLPQSPKIKGAGELMLYGITKYAKKAQKEKIELITSIGEWYKKLGWDVPSEIGCATLPKENYNTLIKLLENKYSSSL